MNNLPVSRSESNFVSAKKTPSNKFFMQLKKESICNRKVKISPSKNFSDFSWQVVAVHRKESEESEKDEAKDFLRTDLAAKLKFFDPEWFKVISFLKLQFEKFFQNIAYKNPEIFIDVKQYDQFSRTK